MGRMGRREFLLGAAAGGVTLAHVPVGLGAAERPITAAHSSNSVVYAAHLVAQEKGFVTEEGLTLLVIEARGGSNVRRILATGQVGYALGDTGHPLQIMERGKPAKILMATDRRCAYANILVRKDLYDKGVISMARLAEYRRADGGHPVIAATGVGSGTWLFGSYILERFGIEDQFRWAVGGDARGMLGGLKDGRFDAVMAVPAWVIHAEETGYGKLLFDVSDTARWNVAFGGPVPTTVVYVLQETIEQGADLTQRYVGALYGAMRWLKDAPVDDIYRLIGKKYLGRFDPAPLRREIAFFKKIWNYDGLIEQDTFDNGARVWFRGADEAKRIAYGDAVDMRFVREARLKYR